MCLFALEDSTYFRNQFQSTGQPLTLINILNEEDQWTLDLEGNVLLNQYDLQEYYRLEMISVENEIALFKCRRLNPDSQKKYKVYLEINLENHQIQILWSKRKLHSTYYLIFCSPVRSQKYYYHELYDQFCTFRVEDDEFTSCQSESESESE